MTLGSNTKGGNRILAAVYTEVCYADKAATKHVRPYAGFGLKMPVIAYQHRLAAEVPHSFRPRSERGLDL